LRGQETKETDAQEEEEEGEEEEGGVRGE